MQWFGSSASAQQAVRDGTTTAANSGSSLMYKVAAVGIIGVSVATYVLVAKYSGRDLIQRLRRQNQQLTLAQRCAQTKKKLEQMWEVSPSIVHQDVSYTMLKQFGIDFAIGKNKNAGAQKKAEQRPSSAAGSAAANTPTKTTSKEQINLENNSGRLKSQQAQVTKMGFRQSDVFLKPFEAGICIEENLTQKHRLIFNKFPARKNHVLVITKEAERQQGRLNTSDFKAALLALKTLDEAFLYYNAGAPAGASQDHKHMQIIPVASLPNAKIPIHDRVIDALQRAQIGQEPDADALDGGDHNGGEDYGMYNNLNALASTYNLGGKQQQQQFFILPEFQKFQHTFRKLNPNLMARLSDSNLLESARYLELNYKQCLHRLENPTGQAPYNFVITKEWMFMVNRSRPTTGQIMINSLGFIGLLYGHTQEQIDEINSRQPLEILTQVAVPVFGGRQSQKGASNHNLLYNGSDPTATLTPRLKSTNQNK